MANVNYYYVVDPQGNKERRTNDGLQTGFESETASVMLDGNRGIVFPKGYVADSVFLHSPAFVKFEGSFKATNLTISYIKSGLTIPTGVEIVELDVTCLNNRSETVFSLRDSSTFTRVGKIVISGFTKVVLPATLTCATLYLSDFKALKMPATLDANDVMISGVNSGSGAVIQPSINMNVRSIFAIDGTEKTLMAFRKPLPTEVVIGTFSIQDLRTPNQVPLKAFDKVLRGLSKIVDEVSKDPQGAFANGIKQMSGDLGTAFFNYLEQIEGKSLRDVAELMPSVYTVMPEYPRIGKIALHSRIAVPID